MQLLSLNLAGTLFTFASFGAVGISLARRFKQPAAWQTWLFLMLGILGASVIGLHTLLLSAFGFDVRLDRALLSLGFGIALGLLYRIFKGPISDGHQTRTS